MSGEREAGDGLVRRVARRVVRDVTARYRDPLWWIGRMGGPSAKILQVGSNDGSQSDPVSLLLARNPGWQAVLVEPVPYLFERLRKRYEARPGCRLLNVAVNDGSEAEFFWAGERARQERPDFPEWVEQLGSFNRAHILSHLDGALEPYLESSVVRGVRLMDLIDEVGSDVDLLHTDCEGYDWAVVSQLDFEKWTPRAILFEHKHLSAADREAACRFLRPHYLLFDLGSDLLAFEKQAWKALRGRLGLHEPLFWFHRMPGLLKANLCARCVPGRQL